MLGLAPYKPLAMTIRFDFNFQANKACKLQKLYLRDVTLNAKRTQVNAVIFNTVDHGGRRCSVRVNCCLECQVVISCALRCSVTAESKSK